MRFDVFTQEEKDYFKEKLGDLITYIGDQEITIDDADNYGQLTLLKYPCYKGTIYLLETEDDPSGIYEESEGRWFPNPQYVYYELTKEGIEKYSAEHEEGDSIVDYTKYNLGE